ncbi:MAG: PAS domain-containing protein [Pseudomonadota bacterium]
MKKWSVETLSLAGAALIVLLAAAIALLALGEVQQVAPALQLLMFALAGVAAAVLLRIRHLTLAHQRTHRRLSHSQANFRHLVETAHEGIWVLDNGAVTTFANARLAHMFDLPLAEIVGRSLYQLLADTARAELDAILDADQPPRRDLRFRRRDGAPGWAIVSARRMQQVDGAPSGTLLMLTDISERKAAELALEKAQQGLEQRIKLRTAELIESNQLLRAEVAVRQRAELALAQSEQRLQEIVTTMPVALFVKDAQSRIILMNKAAEDQWGLPFAEVSGTRASAWFPPEQMARFLADDAAVFAGHKLMVFEEDSWNSALRENRQVQTFKKPVYDAGGAPECLICMCIDITERKRAEAHAKRSFSQLRQLSTHLDSVKEDERKRIARDIHDELGQNLLAIKLDAEMLMARTAARHAQLRQRIGQALSTIDGTIGSVRAIINELHPSTLELGLPAALEWLVGQFERRSGVASSLTVVGADGALPDGRRTAVIFRITQEALLNILRHAQATQVEVTLDITPQRVAIRIDDDGVGMAPGADAMDAGFGLRGIRERLDAFGGTLRIESRRGAGTALEITIPIASDATIGEN